jgi:hypothetical protein
MKRSRSHDWRRVTQQAGCQDQNVLVGEDM